MNWEIKKKFFSFHNSFSPRQFQVIQLQNVFMYPEKLAYGFIITPWSILVEMKYLGDMNDYPMTEA